MHPLRVMLSDHDREVLDSIFNPLEMTSCTTIAAAEEELRLEQQQQQTNSQNNNDEAVDNCLDEKAREILNQSKQFEIHAVELAESTELDKALEKFAAAVELTPQRPSIYNNRGQCLRLAKRDEDAFADLCKAIELCGNQADQAQIKCHALCQRGIMQRKREDVNAARADFEEAAKLGSKFAKQQLVEINPFAALCNQMLRQAFDQLK